MLNELQSLNVPIQGIPLFTYILIGATTLVLAVVTLNETPPSNTSSPDINNSMPSYTSEGGKHKYRQTHKRKFSQHQRQSKKRK